MFDRLRSGFRNLRREPALVLAATGTLAIAIAANTTVFSLVNSVILRPLPYPDSERIYSVSERWGRMAADLSVGPDYYSTREQSRAFEAVAAYQPYTVNWTGVERPEQLDAALVTASFFRVMGSRPMLGRYLAEGEEGSKAPLVAVLSYAFWRSRLGSDQRVVGKTIQIDRLPVTVIGVMPQGFDYPHGTQIWRPIGMDRANQLPRMATRPMLLVYMLARLRPGVSQTALGSDLALLTHNIRTEYPADFVAGGFLRGFSINAAPLQRCIVGDLRPALLVLSGAVGLVLLIACVNLANLLLARAGGRQREMAVRLALGAGRWQIVRQMLLETLLLALPGGATGVSIAAFAVAALNRYKPLVLDRFPAISLDLTTLAFTFAVTLLTGLVFGIAPALSASGVRILEALKSAGHTQTASALGLRRVLVVGELAVSLVLLVGGGLLARSFLKLANVPLGFPPDHLVTMRVNLTSKRYATGAGQMDFYDQVLARIRRLPMVRSAAIATDLPLSGDRPYSGMTFQVEGRPPVPMAQRPEAGGAVVTPEFFRVMGIPLVAGRLFDAHDGARPAAAIVINEAFAHKIFPGEDPLSRTIVNGPGSRFTIAGVVRSIRAGSLGAEPVPLYYACACGTGNRFLTRMAFIVRTTGDPHAAIGAIEQQVYSVDRDQPVYDVRTMDERLTAALSSERFQLLLVGAFALIAIVLAAAGVYGVMSYLVARRSREIGIRIALGARPEHVLRLMLGETALLSALAIAAGLGGAWALTRYARSMLYGITPLDAGSFTIAPVVLLLAAFAATLMPARRAARTDPVMALREE
jgi:putative ABC transport system permease protein